MKRSVFAVGLVLVLLTALIGAARAGGEVDLTKTTPPPIGATAGGGSVPFGGGPTMTVLDDFNRADGDIGANWTVHDGYCSVVSNAATCGNWGRATFNGAPGDGNAAEMDVAVFSTNLDYQALLLDYGAGVTNLFIKIQNQSGDMQFHHVGCYTGNNGSAFGMGFFALSSPFGSAHMKVTRVGNDVTIEFTNIDGGAQPPQTYVCSGAPAAEGTGIGIAGYSGLDRVDNFGLPGGEVPTMHIGDIWGYFLQDPFGRTLIQMYVVVHDASHAPLGEVVVDGTIAPPQGGAYARTRVTKNVNGTARFHWGSNDAGTWTLCVDNLTKEGFTYQSGNNDVPNCASWNN